MLQVGVVLSKLYYSTDKLLGRNTTGSVDPTASPLDFLLFERLFLLSINAGTV
jgi:hypothetical protein